VLVSLKEIRTLHIQKKIRIYITLYLYIIFYIYTFIIYIKIILGFGMTFSPHVIPLNKCDYKNVILLVTYIENISIVYYTK